MSTTSAPFFWYDEGIKHIDDTDILTADIKIALATSAYTPNAVTHEYYDVSLTNEVANGNGYTTGGIALTTKALTEVSAGLWKFTSDNPSWNIVGSNVTAHTFIFYNNTPVSNKPLIGFGYLNYNGGSPLSVTTVAGYALSILLPANGWFTKTKENGV